MGLFDLTQTKEMAEQVQFLDSAQPVGCSERGLSAGMEQGEYPQIRNPEHKGERLCCLPLQRRPAHLKLIQHGSGVQLKRSGAVRGRLISASCTPRSGCADFASCTPRTARSGGVDFATCTPRTAGLPARAETWTTVYEHQSTASRRGEVSGPCQQRSAAMRCQYARSPSVVSCKGVIENADSEDDDSDSEDDDSDECTARQSLPAQIRPSAVRGETWMQQRRLMEASVRGFMSGTPVSAFFE